MPLPVPSTVPLSRPRFPVRGPALAVASVIGLTLLTGAPATAAVPAANDDAAAVDALLHARLGNPRLGPNVGLVVLDARTGATVSASRADDRMLPASNMKVVTAFAALARLGADTRLHTTVRQGASASELVLEGGGDPLLTTTELRRLAARTARSLPVDVPVVVHVDDDLFPRTGKAPGWTRTYLGSEAARVQALARQGDYSSEPSRNAARVFVGRLRSLGVTARLGPDADGSTGAIVARSHGHTVGQAVAVMLSHSENNVAEVLYRQVAVAAGRPATWAGARSAVEDTLRTAGLDASGQAIKDGSGLSRADRLTPRFLAQVLRHARVVQPDRFRTMFESDALPVAGRTGTLVTGFGRFVTRHARCAQGQVQAKTGSLFDTTSLSGVAQTVSGGERVFSIIVNDRPQRYSALSTRQAIDGLTATITGCWD